MTEGPVLIVGFAPAALTSLAAFQPEGSVVVVDEPDVVRKRGVRDAVAAAPVVAELVEWEHQLPGAADEFANARPDLRPSAVAPVQEYATPFAARLAERHGLPTAGLGAVLLLRDKSLLRRVTRAAGIANPASEPVDGPERVREFLAAGPGPVVLKPANRQGAVGTRVVRSPAEVDQAWAECTVQDEGVMVPDRPFPLRMLVERYVTGHEYSVEMLVRDGEPVFANLTDKVLHPGPLPIEMGHVVPADVPEPLAGALREQTARVLAAVGFGTGIVHCEWIVTDDGPCLVECAGRFAGDGIIDLIERAYPVELVRHFYTLMKGRPLPHPLPERARGAAAVRFVTAPPGEVDCVDGVEAARAAPGVVAVHLGVEVGDPVRELRSSWDRLGSVTAVGDTPEEAGRRVAEAAERIRVTTRLPT